MSTDTNKLIYLPNKYTTWYFDIINAAKTRELAGYKEKHHIIPKSLNGSNKKDNLVSLTAREHFLCHWLLTKMTTGEDKMKMCMALVMMRASHANHQRYNTPITSRVYQQIKELAVEGFRNGTNKRVKEGTHNFQLVDRSGHNHTMFDHTIYNWYNKKTGVSIQTTRYDLIKTYNLNQGNISELLKGRYYSVKGWTLQ